MMSGGLSIVFQPIIHQLNPAGDATTTFPDEDTSMCPEHRAPETPTGQSTQLPTASSSRVSYPAAPAA